jgi:hypothetical protein
MLLFKESCCFASKSCFVFTKIMLFIQTKAAVYSKNHAVYVDKVAGFYQKSCFVLKKVSFFLKKNRLLWQPKQAALATKTGCSGQMVPKVTKMVQNVTKWCRKLPKRILFLKCYQMVPTTKHSFFKKQAALAKWCRKLPKWYKMLPNGAESYQNGTKCYQMVPTTKHSFFKKQAALAKWCRKLPKWYKMVPNGANHQTFFFKKNRLLWPNGAESYQNGTKCYQMVPTTKHSFLKKQAALATTKHSSEFSRHQIALNTASNA